MSTALVDSKLPPIISPLSLWLVAHQTGSMLTAINCRGIINTTSHGIVVYYHYADKNIGLAVDDYQFGWNTLTWTDGWPVVA